MYKIFLLVVGGASGTVARYLFAGAVYQVFGAGFPYGTLAVNLSGCFLVGFLTGLAERKFVIGADLYILLLVGFFGAFTTFSTFILETTHLLKEGDAFRTLLNVVLSVIAGFIVLRLGIYLGELI